MLSGDRQDPRAGRRGRRSPRTNWKYCVIRKMKPNSAKKVTVTAPLAALNRRSRNSRTSSIGWAVRRSHRRRTPARSAAAEREAARSCGRGPAVAGRLDDRVDQRAEHRDREDEARAGRAAARRGRATRGPARTPPRAVTRASGTSAQNTLPQEKCSSSRPPVIGPSGHADADDGAPDAERGRALATFAEGVGDDRQRRREDDGRRHAHRDPRRDQGAGRVDEGPAALAAGEADQARRSAPGAGRSGRTGCPPPAPGRRRRGCSRRRSTAGTRVPAVEVAGDASAARR